MRPFDHIAVSTEVILSLDIEGLPTSDRALRNHAQRNGWPIVYDRPKGGKTLFLVDGIPQPFGNDIRKALIQPIRDVPPLLEISPFVGTRKAPSPQEATLVVLFEVFRRAIFRGTVRAMRDVAYLSTVGGLPPEVEKAIPLAKGNPVGTGISFTTLVRWMAHFNRHQTFRTKLK